VLINIEWNGLMNAQHVPSSYYSGSDDGQPSPDIYIKTWITAGVVAQMINGLPSKLEALSSIPSTAKI
jgi:hypothetical protein